MGPSPFAKIRTTFYFSKRACLPAPASTLGSSFGPEKDAPRDTCCSRPRVLLLPPSTALLPPAQELSPGHPVLRVTRSIRTWQGKPVTEPVGLRAAPPAAGQRSLWPSDRASASLSGSPSGVGDKRQGLRPLSSGPGGVCTQHVVYCADCLFMSKREA